MPLGSSSDGKPIGNEYRKREHSKSSSVSSGNSKGHGHDKKRERANPPKEEDRARGRGSPSSTRRSTSQASVRSSTGRSNSQASTRNSDRSYWNGVEELPSNVLEAEDLNTHRNRGNRPPLSESPPPHTPPRLERERSLDSFPSVSGTRSQKLESNINQLKMKRGWVSSQNSAQAGEATRLDREIEDGQEELTRSRRG